MVKKRLADVCCRLIQTQAVLCAAALQDDSSMGSAGTSAGNMGMSKEDLAEYAVCLSS